MARKQSKREERARAASKAAPKGSKAQKAARRVIKAEKAVRQSMDKASGGTHASAKDIRDAAKAARSAKGATRAEKLAAGAQMRAAADIMRAETGREKAEGTRYVGPTGKAAREERFLDPRTDWEKVNRDLKGDMSLEEWRALWGETGNDEYRKMQRRQAGRYEEMFGEEPPPVVIPDTEITDDSLSLLGNVGNVITGLYDNPVVQQQRYLSPAAQDWSDYMPAEGLLQSPAQQRLAAQGGLLYQPGSRPVQSRYVGALSEYNLPQGLGTHQVSYMGLPKFGTTDTGTTDTGTTNTGTTDTGTTDDVYIPPPGGGNGGDTTDTTDYTDYGYDVVADNMTDWVGTTGPEPDYGDVFTVGGNPHLDISSAFTHTPDIPDIGGLLDTPSSLTMQAGPMDYLGNVATSYSGMLDDFSDNPFVTTTPSVNPHF